MPSFSAALSLSRSGDNHAALAEALAAYDETSPSVDLMNLIADLHSTLNDPAAAAQFYERVILLTPHDAAAHRRLAAAESLAGRRAAAINGYQRALTLDPRSARAYNNLGRLLEQDGDSAGAASCYRRALALDGSYAIAHNNLGNVLLSSGQPAAALASCRRACELRHDLVEAWINCARCLMAMQRTAEALTCSDAAVALRSTPAEAWLVRGEVLNALERREEAVVCCDKALALRPSYPEALYARANLLRGRGDCVAAIAGFREALRARPAYEAARMAAVIAEIPALPPNAAEQSKSRQAFGTAMIELAADLEAHPCRDAVAFVGALQPFYLTYQTNDNRQLLHTHAKICSKVMSDWQRSEALVPASSLSPEQAKRRPAKRRIGIVSAHIAAHSVYEAITHGWLQRLDRRRFTVEVFHLGLRQDAQTRAARGLADYFHQGPCSLREWAATLIGRRPDVLIYPEVGMDQCTLQLAAMRLADVQVVAWGHPTTSGLPTLDYYLSADAFEPSDGANHYTERLVRLPNLGVYVEPRHEPVEALPPAEHSFGPTGPLFICAGTPFKYSPEHDGVLIDIARRLGRCQFHFFAYQDGSLSRRLLSRLHNAFAAAGLDGGTYLVLRPWVSAAEFRALLRSATLYLDTIGFSGFNSVMHALECGLPVVSCRGSFMRGRLGSGILERLALADLVAADSAAYVDIVVSLAQNSTVRATMRNAIRSFLPTVYCDQSAIDELQEFLTGMVG